LTSLGTPVCVVVSGELAELRSTLGALITTLDARLIVPGVSGAAA